MFINLSDVFLSAGRPLEVSCPIEMTEVQNGYETFSIIEKSDVKLTGTHKMRGKAHITGEAYVVVDMVCDRCLKPLPVRIDLSFERDVFSPEVDAGDETEDNLEIMQGYQLDVENLIFNEILMNWPMKVLCKADCKGICKMCGKDLNLGECGCDTFVPDPRMAVIKDIFNANKEV